MPVFPAVRSHVHCGRDWSANDVTFRRLGLVLIAALAATTVVRAQNDATTSGGTVLAGVYTTAQAERGRAAYEQYCARCHREDLGGRTAPPLKGQHFLDQWREFKLEVLFNAIRTNMPPRRGGPRPAIPDATYLDIVTLLLQENELPSGTQELTADGARTTTLVGKDGPQTPPSSSLVQVVACFSQIAENTWGLANASRPVRTLTTDITQAERNVFFEATLGDGLYRLQTLDVVPDFAAEKSRNTKVYAKGYLILQPNRERLNLTALEVVDDTCR
jgi:mono/diheme cytochrome c family protein